MACRKSSNRKAYSFAITAVLFWSTAATAFKISLKYLNYLQLLFWASIISIFIFFFILLFQRKLKLLKCSFKEYLYSGLLGFLNPFLYYIVLFKAYSLLPAQEVLSLNYIWPIILVLLSIPILKQTIKFRNILAIIISFIGVIIVILQGDLTTLRFSEPYGVMLAIGSSVIWALFWIYNIKDSRDEIVKLFLNFMFGFIFILIAGLCSSKLIIPEIKGLLSAIYVGIFEMGITFVIWLKALKLSETTAKVSNLIFLTPFISLAFISMITGEKISYSTIIGLFLIINGIIMQHCNRDLLWA